MNLECKKIRTHDDRTCLNILSELEKKGCDSFMINKQTLPSFLFIRGNKSIYPCDIEIMFDSNDFEEITISELGIEISESTLLKIKKEEVTVQLLTDAYDVCLSTKDFLKKILETGEGDPEDQELYDKACNYVNNFQETKNKVLENKKLKYDK